MKLFSIASVLSALAFSTFIYGSSLKVNCEFTAQVIEEIQSIPTGQYVTVFDRVVKFELRTALTGNILSSCNAMIGQTVWLTLTPNDEVQSKDLVYLSYASSSDEAREKQEGQVSRVYWKVVKNFLGFGGNGNTWFRNQVTLHKPTSQPRCLNCNSVVLTYDDNSAKEGETWVEKIEIESTSEFCTVKVSDLMTKVIDIETPASATEFKFNFWYSGTESACGKATFILKALARKCMNPLDESCLEFETRSSYDFKGDDFYNLDLYRGTGYPNLKSN